MDHMLERLIAGAPPDSRETYRRFAQFLTQPDWREKVLHLYAADHISPYLDIEPCELGNARLTPGDGWLPQSFYNMEGIDGFEWAQVRGNLPVPVMQLQRRGHADAPWGTWMVDDPLHVRGTAQLVARMAKETPFKSGEILVAGLGMGLQLFAMAAYRKATGYVDFRHVTVVEIDPDVIRLVEPLVQGLQSIKPNGETPLLNFSLINNDFNEYLRTSCSLRAGRYDAIYWDLAVGTEEEYSERAFREGCIACDAYAPGVPLYQFGLRPEGKPRKYAPGAVR